MAGEKRRVLMIGWEYPPHIAGGLGIACRGLARALGERGHHVYMLLPRLHGDEPADPGVEYLDSASGIELLDDREKEILRSLAATDEPRGEFSPAELTAYPAGSSHGVAANTGATTVAGISETGVSESETGAGIPPLQGDYGPNIGREVVTYARIAGLLAPKLDFDLIHAHDWMTYPAGQTAMESSERPMICHAHATEFDRSGENVNPFVHSLERDGYHACRRVVAVSAYTRNLLIERYGVDGGKIDVVHNGVDFQEYHGGPDGNEDRTIKDHIVLFLGRITFQKGPDYFTRAARKVIDKLPNTRFVMAGPDGGMYSRMIEMAAELGIGGHFHYTGPLNRKQVKRMYRMSDLYIMPSVSEPFGIAPLEAIANGVPVILSKQSGVSEVLSGCFKVDFWNTDELAEKIIAVLRDGELARSLVNASAREAEHITWDRAAAVLERTYDSLLKETV